MRSVRPWMIVAVAALTSATGCGVRIPDDPEAWEESAIAVQGGREAMTARIRHDVREWHAAILGSATTAGVPTGQPAGLNVVGVITFWDTEVRSAFDTPPNPEGSTPSPKLRAIVKEGYSVVALFGPAPRP